MVKKVSKKTNKTQNNKEKDIRKKITIHMSSERQKLYDKAKEEFGYTTYSGLIDYLLRIAVNNPDKFKLIQEDQSDMSIQFNELIKAQENTTNQENDWKESIERKINLLVEKLVPQEEQSFFDVEQEDF